MPTYEFQCKMCGELFSVILSVKAFEKKETTCPKCGGRELEQQITHFMTKTSRKS